MTVQITAQLGKEIVEVQLNNVTKLMVNRKSSLKGYLMTVDFIFSDPATEVASLKKLAEEIGFLYKDFTTVWLPADTLISVEY